MPVRLAASRSLMELRALDRAYNRLKDLVEAGAPHPEALALAIEIQLQRAWLGQARKLAQRGLEQDPANALFKALLVRASENPTEPDDSAAESELTSVAELLRVAEQYLSLGQHVRARALLERVRRKAPENRWAADLLWALDGDFAGVEGTLADLCDRLGPDLSTLQDGNDEPENTEAARASDLVPPDDRDRGFPALFRNLGAGAAPDPEDSTAGQAEVTSVSAMADVQQLLDEQDYGDKTDPRGEDTQIMRVQPKSPGQAGPSAPASRGGSGSREAAPNLADLRPPATQAISDVLRDVPLAGDDEDDSVVVHLRREDTSEGPGPSADIHGLTEELELEKVMAVARGMVEDAHWAAAPTPDASRDRKRGQPSQARTPPPAPRTQRPAGGLTTSWPWWVAVAVGFSGFAALLFVLVLLLVAVGS